MTADAWAAQLSKLDPEHPRWLAYRAARLAALGDSIVAGKWLARQKQPADQPRLLLMRAELLEGADRHLDAAKVWHRFSQVLGGRQQALLRATRYARQAGQGALAMGWLKSAAQARPWAVWAPLLEAQVLTASQDPTRALAVLAAAQKRHPDTAEIHELRGQILLEQGNKTAAVAAFDLALELKPQNQQLAQRRRSLVSRRSLAQRFADDVDKVISDAEDEPPSAEGASYLLDKQVVRVHDSGLSSRFTQWVIRIDSSVATETFETLSFPFTPGEERLQIAQAEVIHADGTRSRPKAVGTQRPHGKTNGVYTLRAYRVVQFANLKVDDVIHVQVTTDEVGERNLFGSFFGVFFPVQNRFDKRRVVRMVDAPASRKLYAHGKGIGAPKRAQDAKTKRQTLLWDMSDVPALAVEPSMPGYGDIAWYGNVSTYESWKALADWYRELVRPQLTLSPKLQKLARDLVKGKTSVRDKVAAIQNWVVKNTRYVGIEFGIHGFKPYKVTQVVERAYGDCKDKASLLIALLGEVGVKSEFVLVRTRDLGRLEGKPATLWAFNHAIAYVPALDTYIDGTSEFAGLGEVPALDQGALILRVAIDDAGSAPVLTKLPFRPATENLTTATTRLAVNRDGSATIGISEVIAGTAAPSVRRTFQNAARRKDKLSNILATHYRGATLTSSSFKNLDALGQPVAIEATATVPDYAVKRDDGGLTIPIDPSANEIQDRYGRYNERLQPLVLQYPSTETNVMTIAVPKGGKVASLPAAVDLKTPFGSYKLGFARSGADIVVNETLQLTVSEIAPKDYPAFRAFVQKISAARRAVVSVSF